MIDGTTRNRDVRRVLSSPPPQIALTAARRLVTTILLSAIHERRAIAIAVWNNTRCPAPPHRRALEPLRACYERFAALTRTSMPAFALPPALRGRRLSMDGWLVLLEVFRDDMSHKDLIS